MKSVRQSPLPTPGVCIGPVQAVQQDLENQLSATWQPDLQAWQAKYSGSPEDPGPVFPLQIGLQGALPGGAPVARPGHPSHVPAQPCAAVPALMIHVGVCPGSTTKLGNAAMTPTSPGERP